LDGHDKNFKLFYFYMSLLQCLELISVSVSDNSLAIGVLPCLDKSGIDIIKGSSICILNVHARSKIFHVTAANLFVILGRVGIYS
jgi:hypothetical protein